MLQELTDPSYSPDLGGNHTLRIFMPADSPHMNLCKTVMSSLALGYPPPTLLNWHGGFNHPDWHFAGSHIAKLESLLNVLDELLGGLNGDRSNEHDLILLVDGYDIWFQLPPTVLIQRYHQLNQEADARNLQKWQAADAMRSGLPVSPPKQKIVVTPGKHCSPGPESGSNPHYEHWPESPMRKDLYGDDTDQILPLWFDPARKYKKLRPRCVNSGFIMGTAGALRDAMQRAKEKVEDVARAGRQIWSDQALLGEVIGDQEMWRKWIMETGSTWDGTSSDMPHFSNRDIRRIGQTALNGERFEFGIGLDYNFTTIPPTCSAEEDAYFVSINDAEAVQKESQKAGVPGKVRVAGIPPELDSLTDDDPLRQITWGDVPLFTDFYFGNTPVGIHHNAYIDNLKTVRLRDWWSKTWFYPSLRELVTSHLRALGDGPRVLATLQPPGGNETTYVVSEEALKGATYFDPKLSSKPYVKLSWDDVCQKDKSSGASPWEAVLFGDKEGKLSI